MRTNIVVFFGGVSVEHDISILTGLQVLNAINKNKYNVLPIYIAKNGEWRLFDDIKDINDLNVRRYKQVFVSPGDNRLYSKRFSFVSCKGEIHCAVLCTHGTGGEDGVLQGVLTASSIPYVSPDVKASAITMDKVLTKIVLKDKGYRTVEGVVVNREEWYNDIKSAKSRICELGFPIVIKPSSLGSSIGVSVVYDVNELNDACELCFELDTKLLAEKYIESVEVNCSAMMVNSVVLSSDIEMVFKSKDFLTFEDKYLSGTKSKTPVKSETGMESMSRIIPAPIDDALRNELQFMTEGIYRALECDGVIRVDFMLDKDNQVYVNEVNTIPGSLSYYLWKNKFDNQAFLDSLIVSAIKKHSKLSQITKSFESNIL